MDNLSGTEVAAADILRFQAKRGITNTFKAALEILEDLETEHKAALARLEAELPPEYKGFVKVADYWHQGKLAGLRKRILLVGNDAYRNVEQQISNMEIKAK